LRALGITEYALQLVRFSKGCTGLGGAALSMATDRPGGFGDAEIEETARILSKSVGQTEKHSTEANVFRSSPRNSRLARPQNITRIECYGNSNFGPFAELG
jgi:hypothetical protein